jgi:hypothetical protein
VPLTLKAINSELAKRGHNSRLERGDYFYFIGGEATDWIDRTVRVPTVGSLTPEQWMGEFQRLKKQNQDIWRSGKPNAAVAKTSRTKAT